MKSGGKVDLLKLLGAKGSRFRAGQTLEIRITAPARIGKVVVYRFRSGRLPSSTALCIKPGAAKPAKCWADLRAPITRARVAAGAPHREDRDAAMHVFVIERHPIYRRGLAECVRSIASVNAVTESATVDEAQAHAAFADADVVILDQELPGAGDLLRALGATSTTEAIVLLTRGDGDVLEAVEAGAAGFLSRDTLTPATLTAAVEAAAHGTTVIAPTLLNGLARRRASGAPAPLRGAAGAPDSWLTSREQQVLTLIADGHPTREVAERLSYSERTVKNVLHDVVTKLGARSRSQAVAHAVRDGLI